MKIQLIKGWNGNSPGSVLEPELNGVAELLIQRGIAVEIKQQKKKPKLQDWVSKEHHVKNQ